MVVYCHFSKEASLGSKKDEDSRTRLTESQVRAMAYLPPDLFHSAVAGLV